MEVIGRTPNKVQIRVGALTPPSGEIELTENHQTYNVSSYATAKTNIPDPVLIDKEISANGTYIASEDNADGYSQVDVDVQPALIAKNIAKNGTYLASEDNVDGYSEVNVALLFQQKYVTPRSYQINVVPDAGYEALSRVVVNPPILTAPTLTPKVESQTYVPGQGAVGFSRVTVAATPLETVTINPSTAQQTITPQSPAIGFDSVTVEGYVPPVEKDVNFYDYDAKTLLYSYTKAEALALAELPATAGDHEWGVFYSWNKSLPKIKQLAQAGLKVDVGALYDTGNTTRATIEIPDSNYNSVTLSFSGTATIDYGDGTAETSALSHTYAPESYPATYEIKISSDVLTFGYNYLINTGKYILKKLIIAKSHNMSGETFDYCRKLEIVVFPYNLTDIRGMSRCVSLFGLVVPQNANLIGWCFGENTFLKRIIYPDSATLGYHCLRNTNIREAIIPDGSSIGNNSFQNCSALSYVYIPRSISNIESTAFYGCQSLLIVDLSDFDANNIPTLAGNVFGSIDNINNVVFLAKNQEAVDAFELATNWSVYAGQYKIKG